LEISGGDIIRQLFIQGGYKEKTYKINGILKRGDEF
jgi:hypothetical protein